MRRQLRGGFLFEDRQYVVIFLGYNFLKLLLVGRVGGGGGCMQGECMNRVADLFVGGGKAVDIAIGELGVSELELVGRGCDFSD